MLLMEVGPVSLAGACRAVAYSCFEKFAGRGCCTLIGRHAEELPQPLISAHVTEAACVPSS